MKDFRQLKVWERAHRLTLDVYKASAQFPADELYGLTSQIRRASMSIPTNIAEGCGRNSDAEFARFLQIAMGSACETEYQLLLGLDLGFVLEEDYARLQALVVEVNRMLSGLLTTVRPKSRRLLADR